MKNNTMSMDIEAVEILLNDFNILSEEDFCDAINGLQVFEAEIITDPEIIASIWDDQLPIEMLIPLDIFLVD